MRGLAEESSTFKTDVTESIEILTRVSRTNISRTLTSSRLAARLDALRNICNISDRVIRERHRSGL